MKKKTLQVLALFLSVFLLVGNSTNIYATEASTETSETSEENEDDEAEKKKEARANAEAALAEAKKEKENLEGALANAEALVSNLKKSKNTAQEKVNSLNKELKTISGKIAELEEQLDDLDQKIEVATAELEAAENTANQQYESMKLRIQYMYENGSRNYVELLLSSKDVSSFLNAMDYIRMLSEYDRNMLTAYEQNVKIQEELKAELEAEYATAKEMREQIGVQKQTVQVLKDAKAEELQDIGEDLEDAEEIAKAYEEEVKAQNEVLAQIQATLNAIDYGESYISGSGFQWPCPSYTRISSEYGPRTAPTTGASTNHKGIDLAAPYGSSILAAESGVVTTAKYSSSAGNYIIVNHGTDSAGNIICTVYMHCSALYVSEGDSVVRGQTIGAVGSTGYSTGNHLHFGVTQNGSYVSPWGYVSRP